MDHSDLIAELPRIEKLTAAERLKIAKERRINQLLRHEQYEREFSTKREKILSQRKRTGKARSLRFVHSVMLLEAAARNDIEEVRKLLMQGVNADSTNEDGLTALHQCCIDDSEGMMKLLLEFGANVNAEDSEKWTPLHAAATCGHLHLVKYLISKGANLLAVNADGNMPYDITEDESTLDFIESEMARRGVTQELIDQTRASTEKQMLTDLKDLANKGQSLEQQDGVGARPLHIAAANGYLTIVEFLLDQHVATDSKDNDGWQPIHAAACWGHLEVVELLVQNGSDLNAQTKNHETPYDICEDPEMKSRIAALRSEQENRARADHQKKGRSQSGTTNTRTHSIRRNSTRDKGQISKKQIKNEAIFGIQNDENPITQESHVSHSEGDMLLNSSASNEAELVDSEPLSDSVRPNNSKRQAPPPPSNNRTTDVGSATSCDLKQRFLTAPYMTTSALNDNTIDIHVSVTINTLSGGSRVSTNQSGPTSNSVGPPVIPLPLTLSLPSSSLPAALNNVPSISGGACTLADLKKQRAQSRIGLVGSSTPNNPQNSNNVLSSLPISCIFPVTEEVTNDVGNNGHMPITAWTNSPDQNSKTFDGLTNSFVNSNLKHVKPSPAPSIAKFQGETNEQVGTGKRESPCCIMS